MKNQWYPSLLLCFLLLAIGLWAMAADKSTIDDPLGQGATFNKIINNVVRFANSLLAPLSTLMVLIAGFYYMTGGGNPERVKTAHKILTWALIGIAIVLLANSAEVIIRSVIGVKK